MYDLYDDEIEKKKQQRKINIYFHIREFEIS